MALTGHDNPLQGPEREQRASDGPELKSCAQCGRVGVRGFTTYPATGFTGPLTVCSAKPACRKRWPKPVRDES